MILVTPTLPHRYDGLRQQHRRQPLLDVRQLGRQRVDGDQLHLLRIQIGEQRLGEQRPAADHRPALDVGIGVVDADDLGGRVLRRLRVIEGPDDLDAVVLGRLGLHALDAPAQVGRVLVAGQDRDPALAAQQLGELAHHVLAQLAIVDAVVREALRLRRVAVERHHRHAARDGVVDRAGHLAGVGAGDQDRARAFVDGLGDALGLDLAVLLGRRQPDRSRWERRCAPTGPSRPSRPRGAPRETPGWSSSSRSSRCGSASRPASGVRAPPAPGRRAAEVCVAFDWRAAGRTNIGRQQRRRNREREHGAASGVAPSR